MHQMAEVIPLLTLLVPFKCHTFLLADPELIFRLLYQDSHGLPVSVLLVLMPQHCNWKKQNKIISTNAIFTANYYYYA